MPFVVVVCGKYMKVRPLTALQHPAFLQAEARKAGASKRSRMEDAKEKG